MNKNLRRENILIEYKAVKCRDILYLCNFSFF